MLHSAHLEGHFAHVEAAISDTAKKLTHDFQVHAHTHGLPTDLVDNLHVRYDSDLGDFRAEAKTAEHQSRLNEYEYGTPKRPPMGLVSNFTTMHSERAAEYMAQSMLHRQLAAY